MLTTPETTYSNTPTLKPLTKTLLTNGDIFDGKNLKIRIQDLVSQSPARTDLTKRVKSGQG